MAQPISYYQQMITDAYVSNAAAVGVTINTSLWSATNLDRCIIYAVAVCAWAIANLIDLFKTDVNAIILEKNPHTARWYVNKVKAFQYGYNLVAEKDYYDNTGISDDVIAASKIIAYAAFVQEPYTRLKLAKKVGSGLGKLTTPELNAAIEYVMRFKDAGVKLKRSTLTVPTTITSTDPDQLLLTLRVKFNPLVLNINGQRIDGTALTPVADAARNYLSNIDFNGRFSVQKLVDAIQAVDGVDDLHIDAIQTKYGALPFTTIDIDFVPDSGYLVLLDANLNITYLPI